MSFSNGDVKFYHSFNGGPDLFRDTGLGGAISAVEIINNRKYNWFPDISRVILGQPTDSGFWNVYACGFVRNTSPSTILKNCKLWISQTVSNANINTYLALDSNGLNEDAHTVASKLAAPSGQVFASAKTEGSALSIGTMEPADYHAFWIRMWAQKGTPQLKGASFKIRLSFDKPSQTSETGGGQAGFDVVYLVATHESEVAVGDTIVYASQILSTNSSLIGVKPAKILMQLKKVGSPTGSAYFKIKHQNSTVSHPTLYTFPDAIDVSTLSDSAFAEFTSEDASQNRALAAGDMFGIEYDNGNSSNYILVGFVDIAESIPGSWRYTIASSGSGTALTSQELWAAMYKVGTGTAGGGGGGEPEPGDTTPPQISSKDPTPSQTNVPRNKTVSVTFNEAMMISTLNDTNVTLKQGATPISVTVTVSPDAKTVYLDPVSDLSYGTVYTITVTTGVKDAAANALETQDSWTFTTEVQALTTIYDHLSHASSWQECGSNDRYGRGLMQSDTSTSGDSLYHKVPKEITAHLRRNGSLPSSNVYCRVRNDNNPGTVLATIGQITASSITTNSSGSDYVFTKNPYSNYQIQQDDCIMIEYNQGDSNNNIEVEQDGSDDWSHGDEVYLDSSNDTHSVATRDAAFLIKG